MEATIKIKNKVVKSLRNNFSETHYFGIHKMSLPHPFFIYKGKDQIQINWFDGPDEGDVEKFVRKEFLDVNFEFKRHERK